MPWDITEEFGYVVVPKPPAKVHFSSGLRREPNATQGPTCNSFVRRYTPEPFKDVQFRSYNYGSAFYNTTHKPRSKFGTLPLGVFKPVPPLITEFNMPDMKYGFRQNSVAFNTSVPRKSIVDNVKDYPAPCDHSSLFVKKYLDFSHSFGGTKKLRCPVEIQCMPFNLDECIVCGRLCTDQGDYWHYMHRIFMCRKHFTRLSITRQSRFKAYKLSEFKPIRDCFFMHKHFSSPAHLKIMSHFEIRNKLSKEAYLDLFMPQKAERHIL